MFNTKFFNNKSLLLAIFSLGVSGPIFAAENCNTETRFSGAAAVELYASLNIPEVQVSDEHGGTTNATAKFGKLIGCQKDLYNQNTECWIIQPFTGNNCD